MAKKPTAKAEEPKRPVGRPTIYRPEMCEQVIEWGKLGKSRSWFAAELGTSRQMLLEWEAIHPEFSVALQISLEFSQRWWEDAGQNGMQQPGFSSGIWSRSMAARFPADWRESKEAKLVGPDGGAIKIDVQRIDVNNLPAQALDALERALEIMENGEDDSEDGEVIDGEAVEEDEG